MIKYDRKDFTESTDISLKEALSLDDTIEAGKVYNCYYTIVNRVSEVRVIAGVVKFRETLVKGLKYSFEIDNIKEGGGSTSKFNGFTLDAIDTRPLSLRFINRDTYLTIDIVK